MSTRLFTDQPGLFPFPYLLAEMLVAGMLCAAVGLVVGFIALRLRGIYLALATIAFVEIIRVSALNLVDLTGGAPGIPEVPQPFSTQFGYMLIALPLLGIATFFVYRVERIRLGRAFIALREDELAAACIGVNPMRYKVLAFTIGAGLAGNAGSSAAHLFTTRKPSHCPFPRLSFFLAFPLSPLATHAPPHLDT